MPLRKKHVRRIVLTLLVVGVLGPVAALVLYGVHVRGGAYGKAVEQALVSRLRCEAEVRRGRPTGPSTAAADEVRLSWTTADGKLALQILDLKAESSAYGWYVTAARGRLSLTGPHPQAALAALNQRLVQVEHPSQLMVLAVERLRLSLDLGPLKVQREVRALALSNMTLLVVSLFEPDTLKGARRSTLTESDLGLLAAVRLNPTSRRGVFDGLHVEMKDVPLGALRRALVRGGDEADEDVHGTADLAVDWYWPEADADTAAVKVTAHGLELSQWTQAMPGGAITGTANLDVRCAKPRQGAPALALHLESDGGTINGKTLVWLESLRAGLGVVDAAEIHPVPFQRLNVRFHAVGDRGWYVGDKDEGGMIPILTARVFGVDVPLLRACARPFGTSGLWPALSEGLGLDQRDVAQAK